MGGAACERYIVLTASSVGHDRLKRVILIALAREIGSGRVQRAGVGVIFLARVAFGIKRASNGIGIAHLHVRRDCGG